MSTIIWEIVDAITCTRTGQLAHLMEERVYPADCLPEAGVPTYKVLARKCSMGEACNLLGHQCHWSFLNPTFDPLHRRAGEA